MKEFGTVPLYECCFYGSGNSNDSYKTKTSLEVFEFIGPKNSGGGPYLASGATISAVTHGPYLTIDISDWDGTTINLANPFNFAIVDVTVLVNTPLTVSSGTSYLEVYLANYTGGLNYFDIGTARSVVRNVAFAGYVKSMVQDTGISAGGRGVPIGQTTRNASNLRLQATGVGLGGSFSGTVTLKILPLSKALIRGIATVDNFR